MWKNWQTTSRQCVRTIGSEVVVENLEEREGIPGVRWLLCQHLHCLFVCCVCLFIFYICLLYLFVVFVCFLHLLVCLFVCCICLFVCLFVCCICLFPCLFVAFVCLLHFCNPSTLYQQCHLSLLCKLTANPKPMSSVYPTPPKMQHNQSMADRLLVFGIEIFI